jgi:hypothetical protein
MLNVTIAAKSKDAYSRFFDTAYNETTKGRGSFLRPNVGSMYKLGILNGLVLYLAPYDMIVLTIQVKGGRDIVAAYNFFEVAGGSKIVANLINVPSGQEGDRIIDAIDASLADLKRHFGGTKEADAKAARPRAKAAPHGKVAAAEKKDKSARPGTKPAKAAKPHEKLAASAKSAAPAKSAVPAKPAATAKSAGSPANSPTKAKQASKPRGDPARKASAKARIVPEKAVSKPAAVVATKKTAAAASRPVGASGKAGRKKTPQKKFVARRRPHGQG